ncbi:hypothetical protein [Petrocella sp. FN5]|uniref:hypothetical protein n=1 Tax=Petrocella sp. FN5 TaxID=3032002 RepID=UPI0023DC534A|nr:hypothetical protein [Petrocella sp. FN5]MDF1618236.1 hypothetical protein [Petrocella sp. FN5]
MTERKRTTEKKKKVDIVSRMTVIGIVAVVILIVGVTVLALVLGGKEKEKDKPEDVETPTDIEEAVSSGQYERAMAVVKYVDSETGKLMVYDIEALKMITLEMDSSIDIKNEYGTDIALSQIKIGDMIETKYDTKTLKPENVRITAVTWQRRDVSNMVVDDENLTIRIGNEVYTYTEELVTSKDGSPFAITELSPADEAIVKGYKDRVWSIIIINGHGTITLVNHESFIGGQIEVGRKISKLVEAEMNMPISAGVYDVIVSKDNMSPFVSQVMVEEGQNVTLDLTTAQPKVGTVEFVLSQEDVKLYIDDVLLQSNEPSMLSFGNYKVRAEKENFETWEGNLILNQAYLRFRIDLERKASFLFIQEPAGAEAYLDAAFIGVIPTSTPYTPGDHTITLRRTGYVTASFSFSWEDDGKDKNLVLPELVPLEPNTSGNE